MSKIFEREFHVRWSDLDPNFHMRHSAYADLCAATRFDYLGSLGFTMEKFNELRMGPIIFNESLNYFKEVRSGDQVRVNVQISGLSKDGRKWKMHQEMFRASDDQLVATLDISGAWFNLVTRKVAEPPALLRDQVETVPRTADFKEI